MSESKEALKKKYANHAQELLDIRKQLDSEDFKNWTPHRQALLKSHYHSMVASYYALEAIIDITP